MSITPDAAAARADQPAERALFRGLFDDAAVFPPGLAPLPLAVADHLARRHRRYADLIGPLLVPAGAAAALVSLVPDDEPLTVVVVGRPGSDPGDVVAAVDALRGARSVELAGVEMPWTPTWRQVALGGLPVALEVPRGASQAAAIADIAKDAADASVQAKFRTGATDTWAWPDEQELATFIRTAVDHDLGFKLTGGLHHAIAHTSAAGERQHGFLNVIAATRYALAHGAEVDEMVPLLQERGPAVLVEVATRMSEADASVLRAFFTAFGCCGVLDPIGDLSALGLIEETV